MSEYRTWDREEKLGTPPWKSADPKVIAWEAAHGHDVRLKCYPELGCQLVAVEAEALEAAAQELSDALDHYRLHRSSFLPVAAAHDALRNVLDGSPTTKEQSE